MTIDVIWKSFIYFINGENVDSYVNFYNGENRMWELSFFRCLRLGIIMTLLSKTFLKTPLKTTLQKYLTSLAYAEEYSTFEKKPGL